MTNTTVKTTDLEQAVLAAIAELNTQDVAQLASKLERKEMSVRAVLMSLTKKGLLTKEESAAKEDASPATELAEPKEKRVTKSSIVRERILQAKINSEEPAVVVAFAVEQLGMARPLARVYVKENWPKVEYASEAKQEEQQAE